MDHAQQLVADQISDALAARQNADHPGTDYCIECGEPISAKRKAVQPHACRCISCQQIHEMETM
jgi:RNA polymerase-binding transcription factor DksA